MWRLFQLSKHLSKPGHPWNKFGSGNRDSLSKAAKDLKEQGRLEVTTDTKASTLSPPASGTASPAPSVASNSSEVEADGGAIGRETRRRLVEWWTKEYSAERMHLCITGTESLDELSEMAASMFAPIVHRGYDPLPAVNEHPYGPQETGTLIRAQTIMSMYALEISFPLEYQSPLWKLKPAHVISHLVGHEGPGSLHSYLKKQGWITELSAGPTPLGRGFDSFKVTLYLTVDGFSTCLFGLIFEITLTASHRELQVCRVSLNELLCHVERIKVAGSRPGRASSVGRHYLPLQREGSTRRLYIFYRFTHDQTIPA